MHLYKMAGAAATEPAGDSAYKALQVHILASPSSRWPLLVKGAATQT
jgi:hypothetical protein